MENPGGGTISIKTGRAGGRENMKVYVVTVNGKISSEGYAELEDAQAFIERRSDKPEKIKLTGGSYIRRRIGEKQ